MRKGFTNLKKLFHDIELLYRMYFNKTNSWKLMTATVQFFFCHIRHLGAKAASAHLMKSLKSTQKRMFPCSCRLLNYILVTPPQTHTHTHEMSLWSKLTVPGATASAQDNQITKTPGPTHSSSYHCPLNAMMHMKTDSCLWLHNSPSNTS